MKWNSITKKAKDSMIPVYIVSNGTDISYRLCYCEDGVFYDTNNKKISWGVCWAKITPPKNFL